jgi:hypothetical protein
MTATSQIGLHVKEKEEGQRDVEVNNQSKRQLFASMSRAYFRRLWSDFSRGAPSFGSQM